CGCRMARQAPFSRCCGEVRLPYGPPGAFFAVLRGGLEGRRPSEILFFLWLCSCEAAAEPRKRRLWGGLPPQAPPRRGATKKKTLGRWDPFPPRRGAAKEDHPMRRGLSPIPALGR